MKVFVNIISIPIYVVLGALVGAVWIPFTMFTVAIEDDDYWWNFRPVFTSGPHAEPPDEQ